MNMWAVIIVAIVALAIVLWFVLRNKRTKHLRQRFGPEYERTVSEQGNRSRAERELESREKRVERLHIRALDPRDRERFAEAWREDQKRFVDDPKGAVMEADRLVTEVMKARGYPVADFDERVDYISVDHPRVVENYRAARVIVDRHKRGEAGTEDLRQALI